MLTKTELKALRRVTAFNLVFGRTVLPREYPEEVKALVNRGLIRQVNDEGCFLTQEGVQAALDNGLGDVLSSPTLDATAALHRYREQYPTMIEKLHVEGALSQ